MENPHQVSIPDKFTNENIETLLRKLTELVNGMKTELTDLKSSKSKVTQIEHDQEALLTRANNIQTERESDAFKIKLMTAIIIRQDERINELSSEVEMLKKESRKCNLFLDGLLEKNDESDLSVRIKMVCDFLKDKMNITTAINIKQAYRIRSKNPRTMKIVLNNSDDKQLILSHISNLKGKKNACRKLFFINEDLTNQEHEIKEYYRELQKENQFRDDDSKLQVKIRKGRLLVNNTVIQPQIQMPAVADILMFNDEEYETIKEFRVYESAKHQEKGSEFICCYQHATTTDEVEAGLAKMKIKYGDATHIATVY